MQTITSPHLACSSSVAHAFAERPETQLLYGDCIRDSGATQLPRSQPDRLDWRFFALGHCIQHQTLFCRRSAFERVGPFDESFRVAADLDWELRAIRVAGLPYYHLPVFTTVYYAGGYSSQATDLLEVERTVIRKRYLSRGERLYYLSCAVRGRLLLRLRTRDFTAPRFVLRWLRRDQGTARSG